MSNLGHSVSVPSVPPTHITILDDGGAAVMDNVVGPYQDGATINLTCMSSGGKEPELNCK